MPEDCGLDSVQTYPSDIYEYVTRNCLNTKDAADFNLIRHIIHCNLTSRNTGSYEGNLNSGAQTPNFFVFSQTECSLCESKSDRYVIHKSQAYGIDDSTF